MDSSGILYILEAFGSKSGLHIFPIRWTPGAVSKGWVGWSVKLNILVHQVLRLGMNAAMSLATHGLHSIKLALIMNDPSRYSENVSLFPWQTWSEKYYICQELLLHERTENMLFYRQVYLMGLTDMVDALENLCRKKVFIGVTHPHVSSRVQKFPAWHTKAAPNGKCCEGYIVTSMVRLMYQLKSVLK